MCVCVCVSVCVCVCVCVGGGIWTRSQFLSFSGPFCQVSQATFAHLLCVQTTELKILGTRQIYLVSLICNPNLFWQAMY